MYLELLKMFKTGVITWKDLIQCYLYFSKDFCPNNIDAGTFRIVIQNNACGKSLSICSLKITLIFEVCLESFLTEEL